MSELGAIADLLESSGEPGLAAAVRVLEYCEADGSEELVLWGTLTVVLRRAVSRLGILGHIEMADRLDDIHRDVSHYGRVLPSSRHRGLQPGTTCTRDEATIRRVEAAVEEAMRRPAFGSPTAGADCRHDRTP